MQERKKKNKNVLILLLMFLSLICLFTGISVSIFNYFGQGNTNNVIQTGRIFFSYSDSESAGSGINITNATPIADNAGVILSGDGEYFDFSVSASTTNTDIGYEIVVLKQDGSTLPDDFVKIYLTEFEGNVEKAVPLTSGLIPTYDALTTTTNPLLQGKTVYYGTVNAGEVAYGKRFRLRMWVKDPQQVNFDYDSLSDMTYKVRVNVAAVGNR